MTALTFCYFWVKPKVKVIIGESQSISIIGISGKRPKLKKIISSQTELNDNLITCAFLNCLYFRTFVFTRYGKIEMHPFG